MRSTEISGADSASSPGNADARNGATRSSNNLRATVVSLSGSWGGMRVILWAANADDDQRLQRPAREPESCLKPTARTKFPQVHCSSRGRVLLTSHFPY